MVQLFPSPDGVVESATVLIRSVDGVIAGLAFAEKASVHALNPCTVLVSVDGSAWFAVAGAMADDLVALPFCDQVKLEPASARAVLLARFPLR